MKSILSFKPYYKWITLNTIKDLVNPKEEACEVLNLIING